MQSQGESQSEKKGNNLKAARPVLVALTWGSDRILGLGRPPHLAGALRWFLRVRNALACPRHERKVPLLANRRPAPWFSGIFPLHYANNHRPGGGGQCCNNNGWRTAMPKTLPPLLWLQNYTAHRKKLQSRCHLVDNSLAS